MSPVAPPPMRMPFVIAEAGSCHEQTLSRALQLIEAATAAQADAIKFQYWSDPQRMRERRAIDEPSAYREGSVLAKWLPTLREATHLHGLLFSCTVYLPEDVPTIAPLVDYFKVASFEARDAALRDAILSVRGERPLFISTGMQTSQEAAEVPKEAIALHCVSAYPCPLEQANLGAIEPGGGYSDHTQCVLTGALAVAAGADYLEAHLRLHDTGETCPDYAVALTPSQFGQYVRWARAAATMRGDGLKTPQPVEEAMLRHRVG